jgi:transposase-like protein
MESVGASMVSVSRSMDEAAIKLLYLALRNIMGKWQRGNHAWHAAMPHLSLLFGERFTTYT